MGYRLFDAQRLLFVQVSLVVVRGRLGGPSASQCPGEPDDYLNLLLCVWRY